ncbi:MAG: nucleotidyltransferase family protein [bacterium]|nr:MAG: nucleotidyltransferase family protein [bacterium]
MNSGDRIYAVVLAGGTASRFGRLKQVEPVDGSCLLGVVVQSAVRCEGIDRVILVLGHEADAVQSALGRIAENDKLEIVVNKDYRKGMSTSLRAGLGRAQAGGCDAVVFLLGDMPMIDTDLLDTVITGYRSSGSGLCYVRAGDHAGHPIIARRDLFDEFMKVSGDVGGRDVVRENAERAMAVDVGERGIACQLDINDPEDMKAYLSRCREHHVS